MTDINKDLSFNFGTERDGSTADPADPKARRPNGAEGTGPGDENGHGELQLGEFDLLDDFPGAGDDPGEAGAAGDLRERSGAGDLFYEDEGPAQRGDPDTPHRGRRSSARQRASGAPRTDAPDDGGGDGGGYGLGRAAGSGEPRSGNRLSLFRGRQKAGGETPKKPRSPRGRRGRRGPGASVRGVGTQPDGEDSGSFVPPSFDAPAASDPLDGLQAEPIARTDPAEALSALTPEQDWLEEAQADLGDDEFQGLTERGTSIDTTDGAGAPGEARNLARDSRKRIVRENASTRGAAGELRYAEEQRAGDGPPRRGGRVSIHPLEKGALLLGSVRDRLHGMPAPDLAEGVNGGGANGRGRIGRVASRQPKPHKRGRIKKLRLLIVFAGLAFLAMIATLFGMLMAVSRNLGDLENKSQYAEAKNSVLYDARNREIGTLYSNSQRILVDSDQISPYMKEATVAIEDQRFYDHSGVDFFGVVRAAGANLIPGGSTQGASTITQQFVKNALEAQGSRTVFQKLRESTIAYHLERQWSKDKILTQYLNTIYFGAGAYGIEAAARTYFGSNHPGCGQSADSSCAYELTASESATLAGIISSPEAFSPKSNPAAALERRNLTLQKMHDNDVLSDDEYASALNDALPATSDIQKPDEDSQAPYFTSWLRQLIVDKYGAGRAFGGGLNIQTTLDLEMQQAAESAAYDTLAGVSPTAAVVVIKNGTGEIKALVGGNDYANEPFNLATQGHRQPGSTIKPFILARALETGVSPARQFESRVKEFPVPGGGKNEVFEVHNYDDNYSGVTDLTSATIHSDNSVYAELGIELGTKRIADLAERMGVQTPVSDNPAMTLGALERGVTPLEWTEAYSTLANDGLRVSGSLDTIIDHGKDDNPRNDGPVPLRKITGPDGEVIAENREVEDRVLPAGVAETERGILTGVLGPGGTGAAAALSVPAWGKTGTTENYGDAWFCGATEQFTSCVWVGYPDGTTSMATDYNGGPVAGGTYPALIWNRVMNAMLAIQAGYDAENPNTDSTSSSSSGDPSTYSAPSTENTGSGGTSGGGDGGAAPAPAAPAPAAPAPSGGAPAPSGGGSGL